MAQKYLDETGLAYFWQKIKAYGNTHWGGGGGSVLDFYPVGSYYETSDSAFDPNIAWGGTWVKDSAGKVTVAQDADDTSFDAIGETGGAKTSATGNHTLTAAESGIRAHHHGMSHNHSHNHASSGGSADYFLTSDGTIYRRSIKPGTSTAVTNNYYGAGTIVRRQVTDTDSTGSSKTTTDDNTAGNATSAHNHGSVSTLQPYIVVNRWHRTA